MRASIRGDSDQLCCVLFLVVTGCESGEYGSGVAADAAPASDAAGSDTGATTDAGGRDAAGDDPAAGDAAVDRDANTSDPDAAVPDETIPIFIAQGMVGRTTISCDDGRTWVGDRSWDREGDPHVCGDEEIVCFAEGSSCSQRWFDGQCGESSPCDCGHSPGFGKGVAYGDGQFVATFGWGWPGAVMRSRNGLDWETTLDNLGFGGIAYGGGRFVLGGFENYWSDDGATWSAAAAPEVNTGNRRFGYADHDGGRFVMVGESGIVVSSDGGETWPAPAVIPEGCGQGLNSYGGILYGNGTIAVIGGQGACRSTDGGETWSMETIVGPNELFVATPVFTGTEFWAWTHYGHVLMKSEDAASWSETPMATQTTLGAVERNPETGTLVAVNTVWGGYGEQQFLRSADGLTWEALPAGAFAPSHPIFHIAFGYAERSVACP